MARTRERDWFVPSTTMTAGLGLAALLLMPVAGYNEIPPYFGHLVNWMDYALFGAAILLMMQVIKLNRAGSRAAPRTSQAAVPDP